MRKIATAAVAVALAGVMAIPAPASAQSASFNFGFGQQDRFVGSYCDRHPNWRGCDDWRGNHNRWGRDDYRNWYRWNRSSLGSLGAGIFGFAVGAALANSMNNNYSGGGYISGYDSHVARCEARFRSYNPRTDMYLGYDGNYHRCRL